jgi:hypothetical protein
MKHTTVNLVYTGDASDVDERPAQADVAFLPRVGDYFQRPYGRGKRYKVTGIVFEADSDATAIFVELGAPSKST